MSVIKSKRGESQVQFLQTARDLLRYTKIQCMKFPKRYTFFGNQQMCNCAYRMLENIKKGNSTYPRNNPEVQIRRDYFMEALSELQVLAEYIDDARNTFPIKDTVMVEWLRLLTDEIKLIRALIKKDTERYKDVFKD